KALERSQGPSGRDESRDPDLPEDGRGTQRRQDLSPRLWCERATRPLQEVAPHRPRPNTRSLRLRETPRQVPSRRGGKTSPYMLPPLSAELGPQTGGGPSLR